MTPGHLASIGDKDWVMCGKMQFITVVSTLECLLYSSNFSNPVQQREAAGESVFQCSQTSPSNSTGSRGHPGGRQVKS